MTFATYANTGPFVNNTVPPGISATFLNNVESFLDQITASAVADSHVTADGTGVLTAVTMRAIFKSKGGGHTLTDWNFGIAGGVSSAGVTVTHGIKNAAGVATTPNVIFALIDANALSEICMADSAGTTTFRLTTNTATARNVWWIVLLA